MTDHDKMYSTAVSMLSKNAEVSTERDKSEARVRDLETALRFWMPSVRPGFDGERWEKDYAMAFGRAPPVHMVEPADPAERAAAIRICRLNAHLDPDTGAPEQDPLLAQKRWVEDDTDLAPAKWLWMWNHGAAEWNPTGSIGGRRVRHVSADPEP